MYCLPDPLNVGDPAGCWAAQQVALRAMPSLDAHAFASGQPCCDVECSCSSMVQTACPLHGVVGRLAEVNQQQISQKRVREENVEESEDQCPPKFMRVAERMRQWRERKSVVQHKQDSQRDGRMWRQTIIVGKTRRRDTYASQKREWLNRFSFAA